jgi:hypothetical protein
MPFLQEVIHKLEVGGGLRFIRIGAAVLALVMLTLGYNSRAFKNMATQEAMDAAQLGRNLAQGKGYTTLFIRPFSIHLMKERTQNNLGRMSAERVADPPQLKGMHPDISNPPVYPVALAGIMKVLPFHYTVDLVHPFWRHQPDLLISLFNQGLFFLIIVLTFLLARRLFDPGVAWLSGALLLCTELFWRFSVSGLSTMLMILIFMGLVWCLVLLEQEAREPKWGAVGGIVLAALVGGLVGLGGLTRYAFGWLILPVVLFLILSGGRQRVLLVLISLVTFAAVLGPWLARNYFVSGTPFGTAGFAVMENTMKFPEHRLERSLEPDFSRLYPMYFWIKLTTNARQIVQSELPKLGGSWITAFFLVGLLVGFRNLAARRLRYFVLGCVVVLVIAQSLGRTQLSEDSPEINSENLLILLAPLVLIYGVSLFYLLLDQIALPFPELRYIVIGSFSALVCLPLIFAFLPPRTIPVAYPPYYPPAIQTLANWLKEKELTMSDVPWAVAWYGQRQSVWLTLKCKPDAKDPGTHEDFFAINDYQKPINLLYLTPQTMDARFLTQWIKAGEQSWGSFILETLVKKKVPDDFPLNKTQNGWIPDQIMLTDWERWRKSP